MKMKQMFRRSEDKRVGLFRIVPVQPLHEAFALSVCGLIFYVSLQTEAISWLGLQLRYDSIFFPIGLAGLFFVFTRLPNTLAMAGVSLLSTCLCGLVLSGVWFSHVSDLATLAGLYPHSDGRSYLEGGLNLFNNHELGAFASRRPLPVVFWALLLTVGGGNIKAAMALMVFLCAMAVAILTRLIINVHGWAAGYVVFVSLFLFYRRFVGTYLTEHLGLALGCLGFILLCLSLCEQRKVFAVAGLFIITLALNARAGAFFILPALALWTGWNWRGQGHFSLKTCTIACSAIILGFSLNSLALHSLGQAGASQGNFSYTLYGLVHGGDWTQVLQDHPEITALPEEERHREIFNLAVAKMTSQPTSLFSGAVRAYKAFFFSSQGPYSFTFFALQRSILKYPPSQEQLLTDNFSALWQPLWNHPWKYLQIAASFVTYGLLAFLAVLGWLLLLRRRMAVTWFLVFGWVGIMVSVPFIPPWDVDLMRVHAATIPFIIIVPALGLLSLLSWLAKGIDDYCSQRHTPDFSYGLLAISAGIMVLFIALPFVFQPEPTEYPAPKMSCQDGEQPLLVSVLPGSIISLRSKTDQLSAARDDNTLSEIRENMGILFLNKQNKANAFLSFSPRHSLALGYEYLSKRMLYLIFEDELNGSIEKKCVEVCVSPLFLDDQTTWWSIRSISR